MSARPPTLSYRVGKLAKKHKAGVAGAMAVALTLVFGLAGTTYGFVRARHERDVAVDAQRKEIEQRQRAEVAERDRKLQQVDALLTASPEAVPALVSSLKSLSDLAPRLRKTFDDPAAAAETDRLRAAYGLSATAPSADLTDYLIEQVLTAPAAESGNVIDALRAAGPLAVDKLNKRVEDSGFTPDSLVRDAVPLSRYTSTLLSLGNPGAVQDMLKLGPDATARTTFIGTFASWHGDLGPAVRYARSCDNADSRSGLCAALGTVDPATLSSDDRQKVNELLADLYVDASDAPTHSAAGWALRKWGAVLPQVARSNGPSPGRDWFLNSVGMTMVKPPSNTWYPDPTVYSDRRILPSTQVKRFWICDCETSIDAFEAFASDASVSQEDRIDNWPGPDRKVGPSGDCPVQRVCMTDALHFCNWLSRHEGRTPAYDFSKPKIAPRLTDGYRVPFGMEWECACRAGTSTTYPWGNDVRWLNDYAVIGQDRDLPCGSRLPNSWGLFDLLGNSWELTWERAVSPQTVEALTQGPQELNGGMRGGSYDGGTAYTRPDVVFGEKFDRRGESVGFRVVFTDPKEAVTTPSKPGK